MINGQLVNQKKQGYVEIFIEYYRVWKEILKIINGGHDELKSCKEIRLFYDDLSIGHVFKIHSMTIVIKSLIEKDNKFYPEISLKHCSYEIKA